VTIEKYYTGGIRKRNKDIQKAHTFKKRYGLSSEAGVKQTRNDQFHAKNQV